MIFQCLIDSDKSIRVRRIKRHEEIYIYQYKLETKQNRIVKFTTIISRGGRNFCYSCIGMFLEKGGNNQKILKLTK